MGSPSLPDQDTPPPEDDARLGTVLAERYRLDALLGEGGMGRVYAAEHIMMRKKLAVKVLRQELSTVPEVLARFEREAMAAANIGHPNVAAATDFGKLPDGSVFLVLEFVEGQCLRDVIDAGPLGVERALHIARQIASALESAHELEIVHRDLKPENVMLVTKGADRDFVKVLDFGIAKVPSSARTTKETRGPITRAGMVFGTPEYMAPEQALGQNVDGRADLYALGVMLYEMLAGVRPFASDSQIGILGQQLSSPPPRIADRAPKVKVPAQAEQIVFSLLAKDLAERVPSATELLKGLDALLGPSPGKGTRRFTLQNGSVLGARDNQVPKAASAPEPAPPLPDSAVSSKPARPVPVQAKPTFLPSDPLPAFTFPKVDSKDVKRAAELAAPKQKKGPGLAPPPPVASEISPPPPPAPPPPALADAPPVLAAGEDPGAATPDEPTDAQSPSEPSQSSKLEPVRAKPTFLPSDPLPAFTFPKLDEAAVSAAQDAALTKEASLATVPADPAEAPERPDAQPGNAPSQAAAVGQSLQQRAIAGARATVGGAASWIDRHRSDLPRWLRRPLRDVSAEVIFGVAVLVAVLFVIAILIVSFAGSAEESAIETAEAPVAEAPSEDRAALRREIEEAQANGIQALEALAEKLPEQAPVHLALAAARVERSEEGAAVAAAARALELDPVMKQEPLASRVLFQAARGTQASDAALLLLEGPMGPEGAEVLYELATDGRVRKAVRDHAEKWLQSEAFDRAARPALAAAVQLRFKAKTCRDKHALLGKVAQDGDQRALEYLEIMDRTVGCGRSARSDCFPCLRQDDALKKAIASIKARVGASNP